ncbi:fumarylacetoacetate hydrolase family protein [Nocardioides sp.]|uniref:fumarylacetoacetate hydrolase family protein n=1 Tax=Nocardioides sp. TaxID=35761 RepID=UPI00262D1BB0|nr:fumarylacetoacetate hydrolase family protein [Nocardioides sp.]
MTRVVGLRQHGAVSVGVLRSDGVRVLTSLEEFWQAPSCWLSRVGEADSSRALVPTAEVELVPPVLPGARVLCIGLNYLKHVAEGSYAGDGVPKHPTIFARWTSSLSVGGQAIPVPPDEDGLDWEGEVVAYIGETLVDASPEEALAAVVGYSTFNDVTARRAQKLTSQWILGKNADHSGPLGPIVPAGEVGDLRDGLEVVTRVNGEVVQQGRTDEMVYTVGDTLSLVSRTITLRPGDLLATGTPSGVGYTRTPPWLLNAGDVVEVEVESLGTLTNAIVRHEARRPEER